MTPHLPRNTPQDVRSPPDMFKACKSKLTFWYNVFQYDTQLQAVSRQGSHALARDDGRVTDAAKTYMPSLGF